MQTYLEGYGLYGFNNQKTSGARYMAENSPASWEYQKHNKSNVEYEQMHQQKTSKTSDCLLSPTSKKAKYVYAIFWFMISVNKIANFGIDFGLNYKL